MQCNVSILKSLCGGESDNRHLYVQGIESSWTPIKPVTTQFAVGRNQTAQLVRKQSPLRPAAATKTIHRSQGDTEERIVVNFNTKRAIAHIHVGLSRATTIESLFITDLCEEKIAVNPAVAAEMELLRKKHALKLSVTPIYKTDEVI